MTRGLAPTRQVLAIPICAFVATQMTACMTEGDVLRTQRQRDGGAVANAGTVLLTVDFEQSAVGPYAEDAIVLDWGQIPWADAGFLEIVEDARGRVLRAHYPAGSVGPTEGGGQWRASLGGSYRDVTASFKLRFKPDFAWVNGGMLPGLAGGEANTAQNVPDGTDGWTARANWETDGAMEHFVYYPDQAGTFGDEVPWENVAIASDRWYEIRQRVVMNTPGLTDGAMQIWLDGVLVLDWQQIRWRDVAELAVDQFYFSTFFGGSGDEFRAVRDEYIDFDDFLVSDGD